MPSFLKKRSKKLLAGWVGAALSWLRPASRVTPPAPTGSFTAHNIRLDDGTQTYPQAGWTMDQNGIFCAARRTLNLVFPEGLTGKTILDVGCLEGGFTTEFARLGMEATGIEVRASNLANCAIVKAGTNLPNLSFVQDDAMNIGAYQATDAVFVCGLLYHLENPRQFLTDAARICKRVIFLDTHVAPAGGEPAAEIYKLSKMTEHEGMRGRWFPEYELVTQEQLDALKWASWSNNKSFWPQKEYLLHMLKELGFDILFEQFDTDLNIAEEYTKGWRTTHSRRFLVGIKSATPGS